MSITGIPVIPTDLADSYITTIEAGQTYFANDPRTSAIAFLLLTDAQQAWYYERATKTIDSINWQGLKLLSTQARQFPRKFYFSPDEIFPWGWVNVLVDPYGYGYISEDVPQYVLDACCEEALTIYDELNDKDLILRKSLQNSGVSSVGFRGRSESFTPGGRTMNKTGLKSSDADKLLIDYLDNSPFIV
jgi:hypothetical protein